jgi:imidazolonepropionase-like amidohydrolase
VNPGSALFPVVRQGGVTGAVAVPEGGLVPGRSAFVTTDGRVRKEVVAVHVNLGASGARALKGTRGQALERLRELLDDARAYGKRRADYEANRMRALSGSRLDLEALQPVLSRELPLVISVDRAAELRAALALGRTENLRIVLHGAAEGWLVAPEIAAAGVPVVVDPAGGLPESLDALRARPDNPARLAAAGVKVLFSLSADGDAHRTGTLGQAAGIAVAYGLPYPEALRAVTSRPAEVFGLGGGRVAEGERADLVLWSGDPLELSSRPVAMWIAGEPQPLRSRQSALLERHRAAR